MIGQPWPYLASDLKNCIYSFSNLSIYSSEGTLTEPVVVEYTATARSSQFKFHLNTVTEENVFVCSFVYSRIVSDT